MPKALHTFHHALGTIVQDAEVPADHPIAVAVPQMFAWDDPAPQAETADAKPRRKRSV